MTKSIKQRKIKLNHNIYIRFNWLKEKSAKGGFDVRKAFYTKRTFNTDKGSKTDVL